MSALPPKADIDRRAGSRPIETTPAVRDGDKGSTQTAREGATAFYLVRDSKASKAGQSPLQLL
jgi:hypothetical protein